jgi:hypothetical protein
LGEPKKKTEAQPRQIKINVAEQEQLTLDTRILPLPPKGMNMNGVDLLFNPGTAATVVIASLLTWIVRSALAPYLDGYSRRKGENLATHEDLDKLVVQMKAVTETTENIKAAISDDVWDRQRQWELKRDAIQDAIRAHADLESALINLNSGLSGYLSASEKGLTDKTDAEVSAAIQRFRNSRTSFRRAHLIADLAVGGQFSNAMSAYFLLTGVVSTDMTHNRSFLDSAKYKELESSGNSVILSARQALGIKDAGDLPRFHVSN